LCAEVIDTVIDLPNVLLTCPRLRAWDHTTPNSPDSRNIKNAPLSVTIAVGREMIFSFP